jgi:hypothetical protein
MEKPVRRRRVEPTDDWEQLELLCLWPEQRNYELIRPLVLFGTPAAERAEATGVASERTLQRRTKRFEAEGVESLFGSEGTRHRRLPPPVARLIVDLRKWCCPIRCSLASNSSITRGPTGAGARS